MLFKLQYLCAHAQAVVTKHSIFSPNTLVQMMLKQLLITNPSFKLSLHIKYGFLNWLAYYLCYIFPNSIHLVIPYRLPNIEIY